MLLSIVLSLDEVTETTVRYIEHAWGKPSIIGPLYIERRALPESVPSELRLTLEFRAEVRPVGRGTGGVRPDKVASKARLNTGTKVTIVKNTVTGTKYPPEWLAQYLGKTGVVLWTTHEGAMVQLAEGATWFPYEELSVED
jgi:hypothetical protein